MEDSKMTYTIFYADMGKAVCREKKTRPVVVVAENGNKVKVHCVTCRNKDSRPNYYVPLNPYMVSGNVEVNHYYWIDKKFLLKRIRDCTTSEITAIANGASKYER